MRLLKWRSKLTCDDADLRALKTSGLVRMRMPGVISVLIFVVWHAALRDPRHYRGALHRYIILTGATFSDTRLA